MAGVHGEGNERDDLKNRFATAVPPCCQVGYILDIAERFVGKFNKEYGKGDVRRHVQYIERYRVGGTISAAPPHYGHQTLCVGKQDLDTARDQRKLENSRW